MKDPIICFMDTETLGLNPDAPVWEFAAIRRELNPKSPVGWKETRVEFFIDHYSPEPWLGQMLTNGGTWFVEDYHTRFSAKAALTTYQAAEAIHKVTHGAHIIGAVPNFDTERLSKLLRCRGFEPAWHYHLMDIENVIVGYLAARGGSLTPPWSSEDLSRAIGVEPDDFARHTAMGDVLWIEAQYDAMMSND